MEAASQVPAPGERVVSCVIQVKQGYLAIQCENTYAGPLSLDDKGRPQTTKEDPSRHGFGLAQMEAIARKHGSVLDLHFTDTRFTLQTALKLP